eukprot:scaffold90657_cov31-Tisochrysis_lutea.AAC.1
MPAFPSVSPSLPARRAVVLAVVAWVGGACAAPSRSLKGGAVLGAGGPAASYSRGNGTAYSEMMRWWCEQAVNSPSSSCVRSELYTKLREATTSDEKARVMDQLRNVRARGQG